MAQLIAIGILDSFLILIVAVGFSIIYQVGRFFNLAHGAFFMLGGYFCLWLSAIFPSALIALPCTALLLAALGAIADLLVFRPLRRHEAGSMILLLTSLGLLIVCESLVGIFFGSETRVARGMISPFPSLNLLQLTVTGNQLMILGATLAILLCIHFLMRTAWGIRLRALSENSYLAAVMGLDRDRMMLAAMSLSAALAGVAGALVAGESTINPAMGFQGTVDAMLACVFGGFSGISGIVFGSIALGFVKTLSAFFLAPEWKDSIALLILCVLLVIRRQSVFSAT